MDPQMKGWIRHLLTLLGGGLIANGTIDSGGFEELANLIEIFIGAVVSVVGFVLSHRAKRAVAAEAKQIAAKVDVAGVPIAKEVAVEKAKVEAVP